MQAAFRYIVEDGYVGSVSGYLRTRCGFSSRALSMAKREGAVTLNGAPVFLNAPAHGGDEIALLLAEEGFDAGPEDIPISLLYEDEDILVLDKAAGIVCHPTHSRQSGTLTNAVYGYWKACGIQGKARFVNRLDRDTSGVVIIAKNKYAHAFLQSGAAREKVYLAILSGVPAAPSGLIDAPIGRSSAESMKREVREGEKPAKTGYEIIASNGGRCLVQLSLYTGRTHQARVHMAHIGCHILSDNLYGFAQGSQEREIEESIIARLALHAASYSIVHPRTREEMAFRAPLPADMKSALTRLRIVPQ